MLNIVKIIKELQSMDTEHLASKIEMLHRINELEFNPAAEAVKEQVAK